MRVNVEPPQGDFSPGNNNLDQTEEVKPKLTDESRVGEGSNGVRRPQTSLSRFRISVLCELQKSQLDAGCSVNNTFHYVSWKDHLKAMLDEFEASILVNIIEDAPELHNRFYEALVEVLNNKDDKFLEEYALFLCNKLKDDKSSKKISNKMLSFIVQSKAKEKIVEYVCKDLKNSSDCKGYQHLMKTDAALCILKKMPESVHVSKILSGTSDDAIIKLMSPLELSAIYRPFEIGVFFYNAAEKFNTEVMFKLMQVAAIYGGNIIDLLNYKNSYGIVAHNILSENKNILANLGIMLSENISINKNSSVTLDNYISWKDQNVINLSGFTPEKLVSTIFSDLMMFLPNGNTHYLKYGPEFLQKGYGEALVEFLGNKDEKYLSFFSALFCELVKENEILDEETIGIMSYVMKSKARANIIEYVCEDSEKCTGYHHLLKTDAALSILKKLLEKDVKAVKAMCSEAWDVIIKLLSVEELDKIYSDNNVYNLFQIAAANYESEIMLKLLKVAKYKGLSHNGLLNYKNEDGIAAYDILADSDDPLVTDRLEYITRQEIYSVADLSSSDTI